jgi:hypothetical protein
MYDAKEEDTKAILEYEYLYDATGLLTQETTTDVLNKQMLDRSIYEYLPNP